MPPLPSETRAAPTRRSSGPRRPQIALLIETSNGYSRNLLRGIRDYMRQNTDWAIHLGEQGRGDQPPSWLSREKWDGLIARIENRRIETAVRRLNRPVVNVSASGFGLEFPTVITRSESVMRLAADHLMERGFRHFAYCGDARFQWSRKHGENLINHLQASGHACAVYDSRPGDFLSVRKERLKLMRWLQKLPRPAGVIACYDIRGYQVLEACRQAGIPVPDELAVIGVHNDELLCELCDPPLSSVIPDARRTGFEAARLLDRHLRSRRLSGRQITIEPLGVALRLSTDVVAVGDPRIAEAVRYLRENACRGIGIKDLLRQVPMSRTLLERRFRQLLGRLPHELLLQTRIRRACELLHGSDLPMSAIARHCGFHSQEYFSSAFRRETGQSPTGFRKNAAAPAAPAPDGSKNSKTSRFRIKPEGKAISQLRFS